MNRDGYQNFFKKAQDVKRGDVTPVAVNKMRPRSESETESMLRQAVNGHRRKAKPPFPFKAVLGLIFCLGLGGFYLGWPEVVEKLADRIEIRAMGNARAADSTAKAPAESVNDGKTKPEKSAAPVDKSSPTKAPVEGGAVAEDMSHFDKLKQRKEELDAREKELSELEEELQRQKVELDKRITTLEEMRTQIGQILKDRVEMDQDKVNKLVDLYANMKPKQAADIIGNLNEELAVEVLAKMKKKNAAEVMNLLPADKARTLSEKYTGYRRKAPTATDGKG